jgi:hypothetical protein
MARAGGFLIGIKLFQENLQLPFGRTKCVGHAKLLTPQVLFPFALPPSSMPVAAGTFKNTVLSMHFHIILNSLY